MLLLSYITSAQLPADDAQSTQILAMANAFARISQFQLITPRNKQNVSIDSRLEWARVKCVFQSRLARSIQLALYAFKGRSSRNVIYTRDIGIAFLAKALGYFAAYEAHRPFTTRIGRFLMNYAGRSLATIAISETLRRQLIRAHNLDPSRVLTAHDGVDFDEFRPVTAAARTAAKERLEISPSTFTVGYCGGLHERSGIRSIFIAASQETDIQFVLVGGRVPEIAELEREYNLPNVQLIGRVPHVEVYSHLSAFDAVVIPYTTEEIQRHFSPLKLFEYMSSGLPVIASDLPELREVINEDVCEFFDPEEPTSLSLAIRRIKSDSAKAIERCCRARELIVTKYSWDLRAQAIADFLTKLQSSLVTEAAQSEHEHSR